MIFSAFRLISIFLFGFNVHATWAEEKKPIEMKHDQVVNSAKSIVQQYVDLGWFSGNVLISQGEQILFAQSYGLASLDRQLANSSCTRFNIGSIAKHYTAVLILQLIQEGKLHLDSTLAKYSFGFDKSIADAVTIEHLLKHQSGFGDIFIPEYMDDPLKFDSLNKKVELLKDKPLFFQPGTDYRYSNYGYIILGAILERITGDSFDELLKKRIFAPISAEHSSLQRLENNGCQSDRYTYTLNQELSETDFREVSGPDGGIESTIEDVFKFYHALTKSDKLLKREGIAYSSYFGESPKHLSSYGGGTGISAAVEVLVQKNLFIVVLANSDELVAERISTKLVNLALGEPIKNPKLPAKHFVYKKYSALGLKEFKKSFKSDYEKAGYTQFMGRALNEAGLSLIRQKQSESGLDIIRALTHYYAEAPQAHDSLAYAYYLLGDTEMARQTFQSALDISPNFNSDYSQNNYRF